MSGRRSVGVRRVQRQTQWNNSGSNDELTSALAGAPAFDDVAPVLPLGEGFLQGGFPDDAGNALSDNVTGVERRDQEGGKLPDDVATSLSDGDSAAAPDEDANPVDDDHENTTINRGGSEEIMVSFACHFSCSSKPNLTQLLSVPLK